MISQLSKTADVIGASLIKIYKVNKLLQQDREIKRLEKKAGFSDLAIKAWKAYQIAQKFEKAPGYITIQKEHRRNRRPLRSTII